LKTFSNLLNQLEEVSFLKEAQIKAISRYRDNDLIGFKTTRGAKLPTALFVKIGKGILWLDIKTQKFQKEMRDKAKSDELADILYRLIKLGSEKQFTDAWKSNKINVQIIKRTFDHLFNEVQFFDTMDAKFKQIIMNKYQITDEIFDNYFGKVEGDEVSLKNDTVFDVYNGKLQTPPDLSDKKLEMFGDLLEKVYKVLKKHNIEEVFNTTFIVSDDMQQKTNGFYRPADDKIFLNAKVRRNNIKFNYYTIIHELGHRLHRQNRGIEKVLKEKYREIRKDSNSDSSLRMVEYYKQFFKKGTVIEYEGKTNGLLEKGYQYKVYEINDDKVTLQSEDKRLFEVSLKIIILSKDFSFYINGKKINKTINEFEMEHPTDDWFPTRYSKTDEFEWFAELFAQFIFDKLEGEPKEWLMNTIKGFRG